MNQFFLLKQIDKIQMIEADVLLGELVMPSLAVASTNAEDVKQPKGKTAKKEGDETPAATDDATADADEAAAEPDQEAPHGDTDTDTGSNKGGSQQVNQIPIMAHPPASSSDLSLDQFLQEVAEHNKNTTSPKGVKLDFKSIDALKAWKPKDVRVSIHFELFRQKKFVFSTKPLISFPNY